MMINILDRIKYITHSIFTYYYDNKENWENICVQCGLCCYERYKKRGKLVINMNSPCKFLNKETRKCTVYSTRFKECRDCRKVNIFHALFSTYMPQTCAYVKKYRKNSKKI